MAGPFRMQTRQIRKLRKKSVSDRHCNKRQGGFTDTRYVLRIVLADNWTSSKAASVTATSQLNGCLK